jgi:glycosyltransferase family protein
MLSKVIEFVRNNTPLWLHRALGPILAKIFYFFRIYILGNNHTPTVLSIMETLKLVERNGLSFVRFGDGEITLIEGKDLLFQKADPNLILRLKKVLKADLPGFLICLPDLFGKLDAYVAEAHKFALHHQFHYRHQWLELLSLKQIYGNTFVTRPYLGFKDDERKKNSAAFKKLFSFWYGRDVILVEGLKSRLGVGNDMFKEVKSLRRILCPPENAFEKYTQIFEAVRKKSKDHVILLSLGPAAKVLAYDLFLEGFRVFDIGHIDMEYEMYLKNEPKLTKVKYKYFNEINERNPEDCKDPEYLSQITEKIL